MKNLCFATMWSISCVLLWSSGCAVSPADPPARDTETVVSDLVQTDDLSVPLGEAALTTAAAACPANNANQWQNQGYACSSWVSQGDCGAAFCSVFACGCHNNRCLATERLQAHYSKRSCTRTDDPTLRFEFLVEDRFISCDDDTCPAI